MNLHARFTVLARGVDVDIELPSGTTTAFLGPNGAGKSTVLHVLAGLVRADRGRATLGETVFFDDRIHLPPYRRGLALLAQRPMLFPRMTAAENVQFSLRANRRPRAQASQWLDLVAAGDLASRRPHELSGGQAQRVALARALAAEPDLLLLDEPLAALDTFVASELRQTLHQVLDARTAILVTHDALDAALLADTVVVMDSGQVVESGPTSQVIGNPRTAFTAEMFGLNLLFGRAIGSDRVQCDVGAFTGLGNLVPGEPAAASFSPSAVAVHLQEPQGSPRNVVPTSVRRLTSHGQVVRVDTEAFAADLTPAAVADLRLSPGMQVYLAVKATEVRLYAR